MMLQLGRKIVNQANAKLDYLKIPEHFRTRSVTSINEVNAALSECLESICGRLLQAQNTEQLINVAKAIEILAMDKAIVVEISHWQEIQDAIAAKNARIEELENQLNQVNTQHP